jgi:hypothetical protein
MGLCLGPSNYLKLGDHAAFCDVCGFRFHASELRKRWDGMYVCSEDYEPRNEQDFIRSIPEKPAPPWSRPRNDNIENPFSSPMADQAGTTNFTTFGPADRSAL